MKTPAPSATRSASALHTVPLRQAASVAAGATTALLLLATPLWRTTPDLAVTLCVAVALCAAFPRRAWAVPVVALCAATGALAAESIGAAPVVGASLVTGALVAQLSPWRATPRTTLRSALAAGTGAGAGLWLGVALAPNQASPLAAVLLTGCVILGTTASLVLQALDADRPRLPSNRQLRRRLRPAYRDEVRRALTHLQRARRAHPDLETVRGLAEVVSWIFELQVTLQSIDEGVDAFSSEEVHLRLARLGHGTTNRAAAGHLRGLLAHQETLSRERAHTQDTVTYALAFLEETTATLTLPTTPGLSGRHHRRSAEHLAPVLDRLRGDAMRYVAQRKTDRELLVLP